MLDARYHRRSKAVLVAAGAARPRADERRRRRGLGARRALRVVGGLDGQLPGGDALEVGEAQ